MGGRFLENCRPVGAQGFEESAHSVLLESAVGARPSWRVGRIRPQPIFPPVDTAGDRQYRIAVMPGDNTSMHVQLIQPVAMEEGLKFAIREGGRTVGAGQVTKILR
ncbi:translation elongation factor EF-Tu-like GTPase [Streptomyces phaeochromogenes]|jgi:elongation factor Tu|nr:translation elongation factor EF-Tu-like GTPase [Streptomyces phaeochromogenes]